MKTQILLSIGIFAGWMMFSGCTSTGTVNTVENANKYGQRSMLAATRVFTDPSLARAVDVVGVNTVTTSGGLLVVQVELQNHTDSVQSFLYHFEWFDSQGMQIKNVLSASVSDQIEGRENKFISGTAPSPDCKDFRVKFIGAN